jgi:hypothetical protein
MAADDLNGNTDQLRWDLLEAQPPSGERLTVRSAMPARRGDLLIAVDAWGRRHILVEIPPGEPNDLSERTSLGIGLQTVEMKVDGGALINFIDIACLEPHGHAALDVIVNEIGDALDAGASTFRISLVQNVLSKWRRFWSGISQGLLSREQQIGLFGELWFLLHWLGPSVGLSTAVRMWRGPLSGRNDFEAKMIGIEVKTSALSNVVHQINGLEQLLEPAGGSLFLMSIAVRDEASATDCLPIVIENIRHGIKLDHETASHFDSCLYATGYQDSVESEYLKLKLRVRTEELYRVVNGFPRLVPSDLKQPLAPGLGAVRYELRLDGASPWRLAVSADGAKQLLRDFLIE